MLLSSTDKKLRHIAVTYGSLCFCGLKDNSGLVQLGSYFCDFGYNSYWEYCTKLFEVLAEICECGDNAKNKS